MVLFDRPYTTFYWSAIVNIRYISGTVFELFDVEWYHDLEILVRGHVRSFKPVPFKSLGAVSYSPSIVTMAASLTDGLWDTQRQRMAWPWKLGLFKVIGVRSPVRNFTFIGATIIGPLSKTILAQELQEKELQELFETSATLWLLVIISNLSMRMTTVRGFSSSVSEA